MDLRTILLCAVTACAAIGCASVEEPPPPAGPMPVVNDTPPAGEGAPITGGELFNGNY